MPQTCVSQLTMTRSSTSGAPISSPKSTHLCWPASKQQSAAWFTLSRWLTTTPFVFSMRTKCVFAKSRAASASTTSDSSLLKASPLTQNWHTSAGRRWDRLPFPPPPPNPDCHICPACRCRIFRSTSLSTLCTRPSHSSVFAVCRFACISSSIRCARMRARSSSSSLKSLKSLLSDLGGEPTGGGSSEGARAFGVALNFSRSCRVDTSAAFRIPSTRPASFLSLSSRAQHEAIAASPVSSPSCTRDSKFR
mmetsp:Transcript_10205/g.20801  ORF Transcript_10205/g.20801 Transcript_10205/m.20801 type:complete len:250 (-) Transcript_10205:117-866(-)